jgi:2-oxoglutarate ferredoxin oxidoreductase subunit gamma
MSEEWLAAKSMVMPLCLAQRGESSGLSKYGRENDMNTGTATGCTINGADTLRSAQGLGTHELLIAGFGGQGVLSMGMTLGYAAMIEQKEISWMPSYGPEMRGGTANCIVIVSDNKISSPIITTFDTIIALNQPSLDKFEKAVKPGGLLMFDSTNIITPPTRTDIEIVPIAASDEASKMKNMKVMNMIVLGAFIEQRPVVSVESIMNALKKVLPDRYHHLLPLNEQALRRGAELVAQEV